MALVFLPPSELYGDGGAEPGVGRLGGLSHLHHQHPQHVLQQAAHRPPLQRHGPGCAGQDAGTQVWARPWGEGPHGWGAWFQREGLPWL